jgi:CofD-related protein of GAK system
VESPANRVRVTRSATLPDPVRIARGLHAPETGARLLFFSGGSSLRGLSRTLIRYTHHSRHVITPFDSGGSSAKLRTAFRMPAVGDLRNRLMALADTSVLGNPEIYRLFALRLPEDATAAELRLRLERMAEGRDELVDAVPEPLRSIVRRHIRFFLDAMPARFDLRGANVGNLVLAAGYLNQGRSLDSVLYLFSRLVEVRGVVRPVVDENLHLVAELADGSRVVGQHALTGERAEALPAPIRRLWLTKSKASADPYRPRISEAVDDLVRTADLICYPVGSFWTSLVATLLPEGVSDAIAATDVPKVYVANPGHDPEEAGMGLLEKVTTLRSVLQAGTSKRVPSARLLQFVLVDAGRSGTTRATLRAVEKLGVNVIDAPLVTDESAPYVDDERLAEVLLSMA